MAPGWIIKSLDVIEHVGPGLIAGAVDLFTDPRRIAPLFALGWKR